MKDDKTPIKTRTPTPQQRLRTENARRIRTIKKIKAKKAESDAEKAKTLEKDEIVTANEASVPHTGPIEPRSLTQNALQQSKEPVPKFKKRQIDKTWLPTHMFHAKRAHMPLARYPLWRYAIPLTPTEKSYRPTHRSAWMRGCVAWDTSYMGTIALEGMEVSLLGLLRSIGIEEKYLSGKIGQKWRTGTRHWKGWVQERDPPHTWIAPVQATWCPQREEGVEEPKDAKSEKKNIKRRLFIRVHPAGFFQVWEELLKVAKIQRPQVVVEDLRFELGSIELMGPGCTEALVATLRPLAVESTASGPKTEINQLWDSLITLGNPASLPAQAVLALNVSDPRLHHPLKTIKPSDSLGEDGPLKLLAQWSPDHFPASSTIFSRDARLAAASAMPTQKAIHRRKRETLPEAIPQHHPGDPEIPILLLAFRCDNAASKGQGRWTLILPWKCVSPVWRSIMHYPLSTGGTPRFGGLDETRQIAFEQGVPWFPGDFPGTRGGWEWEVRERDKAREEWRKKPKGRRIEWENVDLGKGKKGEVGIGWGCDWEMLFDVCTPGTAQSHVKRNGLAADEVANANTIDTQSDKDGKLKDVRSLLCPLPDAQNDQANTIVDTDSPPHDTQENASRSMMLSWRQIPSCLIPSLLSFPSPSQSLLTVTLTLLHRGVPSRCARIYRFPASDPSLHAQWLLQASSTTKASRSFQKDVPYPLADRNLHLSRQQPPAIPSTHITIPKPGETDYPVVPDEEDLIGFVTTGNFNLGEGRGFGIGCVAAERVWEQLKQGNGKGGMCIVRDSGTAIGRVARWEIA